MGRNTHTEGILYADLDLAEVARGKFDFDVVGHYARPDVFQLVINEQPALSYRDRVWDSSCQFPLEPKG